MLFLTKQNTYIALEYEIIHISPANTNKGNSCVDVVTAEKTTWHTGAHKWLGGQSWVSNSSSTVLNQTHLQTSPLHDRDRHITKVFHRTGTQLVWTQAVNQWFNWKITGAGINYGELWKTVKMLTYQCHSLHLSMFSADLIFFTIVFRNNSFPILSKAHSSPLPTFQLGKNCFLVYSSQNSWIAKTCLSPHKHRNHYHHSHKSQACANGWD